MTDPYPQTLTFVCMALAFIAGGCLSFLKVALASSRTARLELLAENNEKPFARALGLTKKKPLYLASLRGGIVFFEIIIGCLGGSLSRITLARLYGDAGTPGPALTIAAFAVFAVIAGSLFLAFCETVPRSLARAAPEIYAARFSRVIALAPVFASPFLALVTPCRALLRKLLPPESSGAGMTEDELHRALIEGEKSGIVESRERTMVEGVFYLGDRPAGAFMTHRSDVEWLDIDDSAETVRSVINSCDQQFFPVASGDLDKVRGIVTVRRILLALLDGSWKGLKPLMTTPRFVPETMPALKAFEAFRTAETRCLFVMDEYGGFAGILTLGNLIEEIVGQLSMNTDNKDEIVRQDDGTWLIDGSLNIDAAAQALSLASLSEEGGHGDYHTLAGFILELAGEIPRTGAHFDYHGYRFTVVDMDGNRIDKVMIVKLPEA